MKFYSTHGRHGTLTLFPVTTRLDKEGGTHRIPGLKLILQPAWSPGYRTDSVGEMVQEIANPGPEMIDTENIGPANEAALVLYWGKDWKPKLIAWLKEEPNIKRYGFVEGDPRPQRKIKVTLTQAEYDDVKAGKKQLPNAPEFTPGAASQTVAKGPRTVGKKV